MKRLLVLSFLLTALAFGQATTPSTTFAQASDAVQTQIFLASGSGIVPGTTLWSGREGMQVIVSVGNRVLVARGSAGIAQRHAAAATVYAIAPGSTGAFTTIELGPGSCNAPDYLTLPIINTATGNVWNCTGGVWVGSNGGGGTGGSYDALGAAAAAQAAAIAASDPLGTATTRAAAAQAAAIAASDPVGSAATAAAAAQAAAIAASDPLGTATTRAAAAQAAAIAASDPLGTATTRAAAAQAAAIAASDPVGSAATAAAAAQAAAIAASDPAGTAAAAIVPLATKANPSFTGTAVFGGGLNLNGGQSTGVFYGADGAFGHTFTFGAPGANLSATLNFQFPDMVSAGWQVAAILTGGAGLPINIGDMLSVAQVAGAGMSPVFSPNTAGSYLLVDTVATTGTHVAPVWTLASAALTNYPKLNAANTFSTGPQTFAGTAADGAIQLTPVTSDPTNVSSTAYGECWIIGTFFKCLDATGVKRAMVDYNSLTISGNPFPAITAALSFSNTVAFGGTMDGRAASDYPFQTSIATVANLIANLPATCNFGRTLAVTDSAAVTGQQELYVCGASNDWHVVQQAGSPVGAANLTGTIPNSVTVPTNIPGSSVVTRGQFGGNLQAATPAASSGSTTTNIFGFSQTSLSIVEATRETLIDFSGTLKNFSVQMCGAQPATGTLQFILRVNEADTTQVITVPVSGGTNVYNQDTPANTTAVSAGYRLSARVVNAATAVSGAICGYSVAY